MTYKLEKQNRSVIVGFNGKVAWRMFGDKQVDNNVGWNKRNKNNGDNETVWKELINDGQKIEVLGEKETASISSQAQIFPFLFKYKEKGAKLKYLGKSSVHNFICYKVKAIIGDKTILYYIDATDFNIKIVHKIDSSNKISTQATSIFSDYYKEENFMIAHKIVIKKDNLYNSTIYIKDIAFNVGVFDKFFEMPKI